jgi:hypothetical protein
MNLAIKVIKYIHPFTIRPRRGWEGSTEINVRKYGLRVRTGFTGPGYGPVAESCDDGNEHSDSVKRQGTS